jgi:hypothetical protein
MQNDNVQPSVKDDDEKGKIKYNPYQHLSFMGHPSLALPNLDESRKIHYMGTEPVVRRVYKNDAEIAKNKE